MESRSESEKNMTPEKIKNNLISIELKEELLTAINQMINDLDLDQPKSKKDKSSKEKENAFNFDLDRIINNSILKIVKDYGFEKNENQGLKEVMARLADTDMREIVANALLGASEILKERASTKVSKEIGISDSLNAAADAIDNEQIFYARKYETKQTVFAANTNIPEKYKLPEIIATKMQNYLVAQIKQAVQGNKSPDFDQIFEDAVTKTVKSCCLEFDERADETNIRNKLKDADIFAAMMQGIVNAQNAFKKLAKENTKMFSKSTPASSVYAKAAADSNDKIIWFNSDHYKKTDGKYHKDVLENAAKNFRW